jgi:hypothetical protein
MVPIGSTIMLENYARRTRSPESPGAAVRVWPEILLETAS